MSANLSERATTIFIFVTECEFALGVINIADLEERDSILLWLSDYPGPNGKDPRHGDSNEESGKHESSDIVVVERKDALADQGQVEDDFLEFLLTGSKHRWVFTKADPDHYPSVPHGHLNHQNQPWPKLNPYTGRGFDQKDIENSKYRLQRKEMIALWNNKKFQDFALEQIAHYQAANPYFDFPVSRNRILILPKWKIRKSDR